MAPSVKRVLEAARAAREDGNLRVAARALDHACERLGEDPAARAGIAEEGELLACELSQRGATLAAAGEWLRAYALGHEERTTLERVTSSYADWRPQAGPVGAPKESLTAGASGTFWVGVGRRGRVAVLEGGITGEATQALTRVLDMCAEGVAWVFVDMSKLSYIGSSGLAVVVKRAERLKGKGGGLSLFALSSNLKLLVETLGLATFLNPTDDLGRALQLARTSRAPR